MRADYLKCLGIFAIRFDLIWVLLLECENESTRDLIILSTC